MKICPDNINYIEELTNFLNVLYSTKGFKEVTEPVEPERVKLWFEYSNYKPEYLSLILGERNKVLGYGWAWKNENRKLGLAEIRLHPYLPRSETIYWTRVLFSWIRYSLIELQNFRGITELSLASTRRADIINLVKEIIGSWVKEMNGGYLMVSSGLRKIEPPKGYRIRKLNPDKLKDETRIIVDIFNNSFNIYDNFSPWNPKDAEIYYKNLFRKRKAIVLIAEDHSGEPAGFIEAYIHPTFSGKIAGYHSLLAVKRNHQGKGLGSALLSAAENWLRDQGAQTIYLHAVEKASMLYLKLGFRIQDSYLRVRIPVLELLEDPILGMDPDKICNHLKRKIR